MDIKFAKSRDDSFEDIISNVDSRDKIKKLLEEKGFSIEDYYDELLIYPSGFNNRRDVYFQARVMSDGSLYDIRENRMINGFPTRVVENSRGLDDLEEIAAAPYIHQSAEEDVHFSSVASLQGDVSKSIGKVVSLSDGEEIHFASSRAQSVESDEYVNIIPKYNDGLDSSTGLTSLQPGPLLPGHCVPGALAIWISNLRNQVKNGDRAFSKMVSESKAIVQKHLDFLDAKADANRSSVKKVFGNIFGKEKKQESETTAALKKEIEASPDQFVRDVRYIIFALRIISADSYSKTKNYQHESAWPELGYGRDSFLGDGSTMFALQTLFSEAGVTECSFDFDNREQTDDRYKMEQALNQGKAVLVLTDLGTAAAHVVLFQKGKDGFLYQFDGLEEGSPNLSNGLPRDFDKAYIIDVNVSN